MENKTYVDFESIGIQLASPAQIRKWSYGEVKKPETVNYRHLQPERDGLFCERIFGTTKDWECYCGKFKSIRYKGVICDRCSVEVTHSRVRRVRMGHIELACSVAHIWHYRSVPSRMGLLLNLTVNQLKSVLFFEKFIVIEPAESGLEENELIDEEEYYECLNEYGDKFVAMIGGEAVQKLLERIDVDAEIRDIRARIQVGVRVSDRRILKRLEVLEAIKESSNQPSWMMLEVLPVIPPELRPMVQLEGGRFAISDLNDLYRRVINRNNRLKRLLALKAPEIIVRNEKRMLQEAVDALFDNNNRQRAVKTKGNRPLKSLSDMLKGKSGRFRQNLLGKRVDYSGRSVIVIGPELKIYEMGLPKKMALELFKPFIMKRLVDLELAANIKAAKRKVDSSQPEVFEALGDIIKGHPVLLNRAPTLHRLGIQAFLPVLIEGKAMRLHPLMCHAFNADFDGDQMAIHLPLSPKAQLEAWVLMLSAHNFLNPANGAPVVGPTQDMVLGLYLLTSFLDDSSNEEAKSFANLNEVHYALDRSYVKLRSKVSILLNGKLIQTTPGRIIFNDILPEAYPFVNHAVTEKEMNKIIADIYDRYSSNVLVKFLDKMKQLGFHYATIFSPSISPHDIKISPRKSKFIDLANKEISEVQKAHKNGVITNEERYKKVIEIWTKTNEKITDSMFELLEKDQSGFNPIYIMAISGARGSKQQIRQLAGMRGLMARPSGEIIELAIQSNFREGLGVLEFFISTHGARKGLADTALKTADAGYLTRRLVDIAQDVIVKELDCGVDDGLLLKEVRDGEKIILSLKDRVFGRTLLKPLLNPSTSELLIEAGTIIGKKELEFIHNLGLDSLEIRSPLKCKARHGICAKCYGIDMARLKPVEQGEAVGIIAAQSIGQPGTQLTMRTFHVGGVATNLQVRESTHFLPYPIFVKEVSGQKIKNSKGDTILVSRGTILTNRIGQSLDYDKLDGVQVQEGTKVVAGEVIARGYGDDKNVVTANGDGQIFIKDNRLLILMEQSSIPIKIGTIVKVEGKEILEKNHELASFDPFNDLIVAEKSGKVFFENIEEDKNFKKDEEGNFRIFEYKRERLNPRIHIDDKVYLLPIASIVLVGDGQKVEAGETLAKISKDTEKTRDITGGLPRVEELFEARRPKNACTLAEISGTIEDHNEVVKDKKVIYIISEGEEDKVKVSIPLEKQMRVLDGDTVQEGDQLDDGTLDPHEILATLGLEDLHEFLIAEIQEVYRLQGVHINEKHIETIVRQMLRKMEIIDPGDSKFVEHQQVDRFAFDDENRRVMEEGGEPATGCRILLGITKASLNTESFISAASFQETTKVLTDAAIHGRKDYLLGLKENVIIGHLIPAGTGLKKYRNIGVYNEVYGDLEKLGKQRKDELSHQLLTIKPSI